MKLKPELKKLYGPSFNMLLSMSTLRASMNAMDYSISIRYVEALMYCHFSEWL